MDLMRRHVVRLRESGKSRAEAADSLMSFKKGPSYLPLLDEVYPDDARGSTADR
jgi:hypothetical protein